MGMLQKHFTGILLLTTALATVRCGDAQHTKGDIEVSKGNDESLFLSTSALSNNDNDLLQFSEDEVASLPSSEELAQLEQIASQESDVSMASAASAMSKAAATKGGGVSVKVVISVATQTMRVYEAGALKYTWKTSTGSTARYGKGAATPRGSWHPFLMDANYHSRQFNVKLPYGIKFVGGILIHASNGPMGVAKSHGCVRLAPGNAKTLFALVRKYGMKKTLITVQ